MRCAVWCEIEVQKPVNAPRDIVRKAGWYVNIEEVIYFLYFPMK